MVKLLNENSWKEDGELRIPLESHGTSSHSNSWGAW
jgi:hypothetical protein